MINGTADRLDLGRIERTIIVVILHSNRELESESEHGHIAIERG